VAPTARGAEAGECDPPGYAWPMLLGAHESVAGGAFLAIERGLADGCEAVQIFARPAARWQAKPMPAEELSRFRSEHAAVGWPVLSHASYLINPCAVDPVIRKRSLEALEEEMVRGEEMGLDYVVLHPGAHMGGGQAEGITAVASTLSALHERTRGFGVRLLLELTAGQGSCLGCRFEDLARILDATTAGDRLGVCFDTCHALAAGYDLTSDEGYDGVFAAFDRVVGIDRLAAFHLNDSKLPLGSRVDRHEEIGDGYLGLLPFWRLVNDPRFARLPGILETPSGPDKVRSFARNLVRLRALIASPRPGARPPSQSASHPGQYSLI
jgi:deoxyribonuclease-4